MDDQAIEKLVEKMREVFPTTEQLNQGFKTVRADIKEVRTDIANHDHRYNDLAESVNKLHDDLAVKKDVERIKEFLREKLHAEI